MVYLSLACILLSWALTVLGSSDPNLTPKEKNTGALNAENKFIVLLDPQYTHDHFEKFFLESARKTDAQPMIIHHKYTHALNGLAVSNIDEQTLLTYPGVRQVSKDTLKYRRAVTWGQDRIDQSSLPPDFKYSPEYTGKGVDVYIVDDPIYTSHFEFSSPNSSVRTVTNIWPIPANTGGTRFHATHIAGTIGGKTVGISPAVSMFGLDVFGGAGGFTSNVLAALDVVAARFAESKKPSIVNMSIGGGCDNEDCSTDPLVLGVEALIAKGVVVVVAAGNDATNACFFSPDSAPNAITVGSINSIDQMAYYSDWGQCMDLYAPGENVYSACVDRSDCSWDPSNNDRYRYSSGNSFAAPHVVGVVAQLYEKDPTLTVAQIYLALTCLGVQDRMTNISPLDTVTRNLVLQIPRANNSLTCTTGAGCPNDCTGRGFCAAASITSSKRLCLCDRGSAGRTCSSSSSCASPIVLNLSGYGWGLTRIALLDSTTGYTVANLFDTLNRFSGRSRRTYCVDPGSYTLIVTAYESFNGGWTMCGYTGGANFYGILTSTAPGVCSITAVATRRPTAKATTKNPTTESPTVKATTSSPTVSKPPSAKPSAHPSPQPYAQPSSQPTIEVSSAYPTASQILSATSFPTDNPAQETAQDISTSNSPAIPIDVIAWVSSAGGLFVCLLALSYARYGRWWWTNRAPIAEERLDPV